MILLKQRVSGYWEQTAPKSHKEKRSYVCVCVCDRSHGLVQEGVSTSFS